MGFISQTIPTYFEVNAKANGESLEELLLCVNTGGLDCDVDLSGINILDVLSLAAIAMVSFLPVVALLFSFDPKACKKIASRKTRTTAYITHNLLFEFCFHLIKGTRMEIPSSSHGLR